MDEEVDIILYSGDPDDDTVIILDSFTEEDTDTLIIEICNVVDTVDSTVIYVTDVQDSNEIIDIVDSTCNVLGGIEENLSIIDTVQNVAQQILNYNSTTSSEMSNPQPPTTKNTVLQFLVVEGTQCEIQTGRIRIPQTRKLVKEQINLINIQSIELIRPTVDIKKLTESKRIHLIKRPIDVTVVPITITKDTIKLV